MLTHKQGELLSFLHTYVTENGEAPTFEEMKDHLGLTSKSGIHRLMSGLEERGYVRRTHGVTRAIHEINVPKALMEGNGRHEDFPAAGKLVDDYATQGLRRVPVMGSISDATPVSALRERKGQLAVPADGLEQSPHYALTVEGDSMRDAGLRDGDTIVLRRQDTASDGDLVAVLVDGREASIRRFRTRGRGGAQVTLETANPAYPTATLPAGRVRVQGVVTTMMRSC